MAASGEKEQPLKTGYAVFDLDGGHAESGPHGNMTLDEAVRMRNVDPYRRRIVWILGNPTLEGTRWR